MPSAAMPSSSAPCLPSKDSREQEERTFPAGPASLPPARAESPVYNGDRTKITHKSPVQPNGLCVPLQNNMEGTTVSLQSGPFGLAQSFQTQQNLSGCPGAPTSGGCSVKGNLLLQAHTIILTHPRLTCHDLHAYHHAFPSSQSQSKRHPVKEITLNIMNSH